MKNLLELQAKYKATNNSGSVSPSTRLRVPKEFSSIQSTSPVKMEPNKILENHSLSAIGLQTNAKEEHSPFHPVSPTDNGY